MLGDVEKNVRPLSYEPKSWLYGLQVWALYDGVDGMPRFYAYIHRAYKMRNGEWKWSCSWLEGKGGAAGSKLSVNGEKVSPGCGLFGYSIKNQQETVNVFSHLVGVGKLLMEKGQFAIWPMRDQVWALFSEGGGGESKKEAAYDLVVVTEDYSVENGTVVRYLEKQEDKNTVFRVSLGFMQCKDQRRLKNWVYVSGAQIERRDSQDTLWVNVEVGVVMGAYPSF